MRICVHNSTQIDRSALRPITNLRASSIKGCAGRIGAVPSSYGWQAVDRVCGGDAVHAAAFAFGLLRLVEVRNAAEDLARVQGEKVRLATQWRGMLEVNITRLIAMNVGSDPAVSATFKDEVPKTIARISETRKKLEALPLTEADRAQLKRIDDLRSAVLAQAKAIDERRAAGDLAGATALARGELIASSTPYFAALDEFVAMQERTVASTIEAMEASGRTLRAVLSVLLIVLLFGAASPPGG